MKRYALVAALLVLLLALLSLTFLNRSAPKRSDLSATFTDLVIIGNGPGLHALFTIANQSAGHNLQFGIEQVQKPAGTDWRDYPTMQSGQVLGKGWPPCFREVCAIPWPSGLPTNSAWRLRLWVKREPPLIIRQFNQRLHFQLFPPYGRHCVTSSVVVPVPVVIDGNSRGGHSGK